jgi:hypothetical protein
MFGKPAQASVIAFSLTFALMVATAYAAENPRKMTVVSFGLFGDQGVFRSEATGAAQIVASRFGSDSVVVRTNTKMGGSATVETLATTLQAEAKKMNGESDILFANLPSANDFSSCKRMEDIGRKLLKSVGCDEDQITDAMITRAIEVNDNFIARLEAIRDRAQEGMN